MKNIALSATPEKTSLHHFGPQHPPSPSSPFANTQPFQKFTSMKKIYGPKRYSWARESINDKLALLEIIVMERNSSFNTRNEKQPDDQFSRSFIIRASLASSGAAMPRTASHG